MRNQGWNQNLNKIWLLCLAALLASCGSNPPAPVIDRQPANKPAASTPAPSTSTAKTTTKPTTNRPTYKPGDWRPSTYTVKKGDTLFSIGLEFGYDYKELAQANNIAPPYNIRVGQTLTLAGTDDKQAAGVVSSDGVVTYPMNNDGGISAPDQSPAKASPKTSNGVVVLNEPKAIREPFSQKALETVAIVPPKTADKATDKTADKLTTGTDKTTSAAASKPDAKSDAKPDSKPDVKSEKPDMDSAEDLDWAWPTKGKVVAGFNESSNKGLDISGTSGQAITAAAPGKVIYSGSDLRGYGKLVIIKHNKNYLSVYAHNSAIVVKEGQQVARGQKVAEMGNTDSDTVKLHFEIRRQGKSVDPSKYLSAN
jgi:lipoprotein NlpD